MKFIKLSKKIIIIFTAIVLIVGFLTTVTCLGYCKKDASNIQTIKNEYPEYSKKVQYDENKDFPKIKDFYEKTFQLTANCSSEAGRISKNGFKKEIYNLKNVVEICEDSSIQIKNTKIPDKLPETTTSILEKSREKLSNSCKKVALSFEYLIKANGDYDAENNPDAMRAWTCYLEASGLNKSANNDIKILEILYESKGGK